jgi:hypothetical protein
VQSFLNCYVEPKFPTQHSPMWMPMSGADDRPAADRRLEAVLQRAATGRRDGVFTAAEK